MLNSIDILWAQEYPSSEFSDFKQSLINKGARVSSILFEEMNETLQNGLQHLTILIALDPLHTRQALRILTEYTQVPIIILGKNCQEDERIHYLDEGADRVLLNTISDLEFHANIEAVFTRNIVYCTEVSPKETKKTHAISNSQDIFFGGYAMDTLRRIVWNGETEIPLTHGEFELLKILALNSGKAVSRLQLMEKTKSRDWDPTDRSIDVLVGRLRRKLEENPKTPKIIQTIRGIGYTLATEAKSKKIKL